MSEPGEYLPFHIAFPEGTVGSDNETAVSQRQLRDHERIDESRRDGDLAMAKQRHQEIRDDLKGIREAMTAAAEALQTHAETCPAIGEIGVLQTEVKGLTWRFWLLVGLLAASGGGFSVARFLI